MKEYHDLEIEIEELTKELSEVKEELSHTQSRNVRGV